MIIGIDLGTTFSVLAINGRVSLADGYPQPTYLDDLDVTIIPDPYGNEIIPSAVWEDPDEPGRLIVGAEAKEAASQGYSPILFSKRNIGTNVPHRLGQREYSAREVAREILVHLKGVAEQALGAPVEQAVITHPAYFDPAMRIETAAAARDAGFAFNDDLHLLMEPAAAALAYTHTDARDPLRLLTYDLGGGTFDVTVMERRQGATTVTAFGGNRLLGGFNFDRALAEWMYARLRQRGVRLTLEPEDPAHSAKWAYLMQVAEQTKIKLADARTDLMYVPIRGQSVFTDDDGRSVSLTDRITRREFVGLIQEMLDETIHGQGGGDTTKGCEMTLAEAGLSVSQLDEILLVGGSALGPWVAETIERKWGRRPRLFEPDRVVAAGAAIHARSLPEKIQCAGCSVELEVPQSSPLAAVAIGGRVHSVQGPTKVSQLAVTLAADTGREYSADVGASGDFILDDVELAPERATSFLLRITGPASASLAEHHFEIAHVPDDLLDGAGMATVLTVLPKPLFIEVVGGMEPLAAEGATLPARCEVELARANDDDVIEIRLFQEYDPIGSVIIKEVPPEARVGSKVKLTVEITRSNRIQGRAVVFTRKGSVTIEAPVDISIPRIDVPKLTDLRAEYAELEAELAERVDLEPDAETRMTLQAQGDRGSAKVQRLLGSPRPDRQEVWSALRALKRTVRPSRDDLQPPLEQFERLVTEIKDLLATHSSDPQVQSHTSIVERVEGEARAAYGRRDRRRWAQANSSLQNLLRRLERPGDEPPSNDIPPTALQKLYASMQLDQTRQLLRAKETEFAGGRDLDRIQRRVSRLWKGLDEVQEAIEQIADNMDPKTAHARITLLLLRQVKPIADEVPKLGGPDLATLHLR